METRLLQRAPLPTSLPHSPAALVEREWIVTNALGGYAAGTLAGVSTRRYHGLLIAAPPRAARPHDDVQSSGRGVASA